MNTLRHIVLTVLVTSAFLNAGANEPVLDKLKSLDPTNSRLDTQGRLTEEDRQALKYALEDPDTAVDAAIDLWIDGQDSECLELLWWRTKPEERAARLLVIALMNTQWEPTSALVPFGLYARRFNDDESSIRISEVKWHSDNAKLVGRLLTEALAKLAKDRQAPHLVRLIERYKVVAQKGLGSL
jgi:hypothetical protein